MAPIYFCDTETMADFIIIIRAEPDASRDVAWLKRYEVPAIAVPVMQMVTQPFALSDAPSLQAIVFTSRHAVAVVAESTVIGSLRALPAYAVGHRTAVAARQAGFDTVITGHGGGSGLVPLLADDLQPHGGALLWPSATTISFDVAASLGKLGFVVQRMPVYTMTAIAHVGTHLADRLAATSSAAVVAMSTRSIELFSKMLMANQMDEFRHIITVVAGSPAIAAIAGSGWADILVAKAPRRSRLLAIATFIHRQRALLPRDR